MRVPRLLMMATLVSQFAKAGSLLSAMTGLPEAGLRASAYNYLPGSRFSVLALWGFGFRVSVAPY